MPSILEMLSRELEALTARREAMLQELDTLPKGYISKKEIKGRDYFYLQHREGQRIKSQLIKQGKLEPMLEAVRRKQQLKQALREIDREQKQLDRLLKREQRRLPLRGMKEKTI